MFFCSKYSSGNLLLQLVLRKSCLDELEYRFLPNVENLVSCESIAIVLYVAIILLLKFCNYLFDLSYVDIRRNYLNIPNFTFHRNHVFGLIAGSRVRDHYLVSPSIFVRLFPYLVNVFFSDLIVDSYFRIVDLLREIVKTTRGEERNPTHNLSEKVGYTVYQGFECNYLCINYIFIS